MALLTAGAGRSVAATFGTVVPIGGTASDIALDEARGVLYIADFTCACIDVMSLTDYSISTSMSVAPFPAGIAMSPNGQYLVVVHYANYNTTSSTAAVPPVGGNLATVINLSTQAQTTYQMGESPLGVSFVNTLGGDQGGLAFIVTTAHVMTLNPETGEMNILASLAELSKTIPQAGPGLPGAFTEAAVTTSGDGWTAWAICGGGTGTELIFWFNMLNGSSNAVGWITTPALLPRLSVSQDGSHAMAGYVLYDADVMIAGLWPNPVASTSITGSAYDSIHGIIYGQFPDASQPATTPLPSSNTPTGTTSLLPSLLVLDADNLTYRERLTLNENLVGRAVLNAAATVMYAISDSGVTVLPVGFLNKYNRIEPGQEDVLIQTSFCNQSQVSQTFTLADPGGNHTDFELSTPFGSGVLVSPSSGVTPATITVTADPTAFAGARGTSVVALTIGSAQAINQPIPVRVLISNPDQDQRGTVVDVPGVLSDIVSDASRNRFYITRQDRNKVLIYDGATSNLIGTLRTATTPAGMAMTLDQKYLLVVNNNSNLVNMFDLDALQALPPITLPGSDYGRSIAVSNSAILALVRNESDFTGRVVVLDTVNKIGTEMPTLGPWTNSVSDMSVMSGSPNGAYVLLAGPDGRVLLYDASSNSFAVYRKDYASLSGSYGASSYEYFVAGSAILNSSLVPVGAFNTAGGDPSGFLFVDGNDQASGYFVTAASSASPGAIQCFGLDPTANPGCGASLSSAAESPIPLVEAPLLPTQGSCPVSSATGTCGSGTSSATQATNFSHTVAQLPASGEIVVLTTSGFTVLGQKYGAAFTPPILTSIVNAANDKSPVAPGGLITVWGTGMSPTSVVASQVPLPTALGQSCLSVNGTPVPLLFVSSTQINAQLPNNVIGASKVAIHTPGGVSNSLNFTVQSAAPSVFMSGSAGPVVGLATVVRAANNQIVTPTNPIRQGDTLVIYLTGMGLTTPGVTAGEPAPLSSPFAPATIVPIVTLGGTTLTVEYAGRAPGEIGVDQINVVVPGGVTSGLDQPLVISQGTANGASISLGERVVAN
ncbi:MAG: hypothetical protein WBL61_23905 [Bryobacteraceae bacterium]